MKVAVLSGGVSPEHEISLSSGKSVAAGLIEAGHEPVEVLITKDGQWTHGDRPIDIRPMEGLLDCEVAFPALHGPGGEDGTVQAVFEVLDIAYVGSGVEASALCMDKLALKALAAASGIPQVPYLEAGPNASVPDDVSDLGLPLWVQPGRGGSSLGISKVESLDRLPEAVEEAASMDSRVIIEANSPGKEVECSVLGNQDLITSSPGELRVNSEWYDYEAKYEAGGMDLEIPAEITDSASIEVERLAKEIFRLAGCSGMARCDFFVEGDLVLLNEVNTIPGFTSTSVYGKLLEHRGIAYPDLCSQLLDLAIEAKETRDSLRG